MNDKTGGPALLDQSVDILSIPSRIWFAFQTLNIKTIRDVSSLDKHAFLRTKNISRGSVRDLSLAMARIGAVWPITDPGCLFLKNYGTSEKITWLDACAMQVLSGMSPTEQQWIDLLDGDANPAHAAAAKFAYDSAEAMLAEKRKREG